MCGHAGVSAHAVPCYVTVLVRVVGHVVGRIAAHITGHAIGRIPGPGTHTGMDLGRNGACTHSCMGIAALQQRWANHSASSCSLGLVGPGILA